MGGLFYLLVKYAGLWADDVADAALNAFFYVCKNRFTLVVCFKRSIVDGRTKGNATSAIVALSRFLYFLDKVKKGFHSHLRLVDSC